MSKSIFISHAEKDKELAKLVVDLIEDGIGVPESEIFCSSLVGYDIPTGSDFIEYIKSEIEKPKVFIPLISPSYYNSKFCLCELGAAWVLSHKWFPFIVPPITNNDVKAVLNSTQVTRIDNYVKLLELREMLINEVAFERKSDTKFESKRKYFEENLPPILSKIFIPEDHSVLNIKLEQKTAELAKCHELNQKLNEHINLLNKKNQSLDEVKEKILASILHGGSTTSDIISFSFKIPKVEAEVHLNNLSSKYLIKLITSRYHLTVKGKQYIVEHKLHI